MKIVELRQEDEPTIVYSICKLIGLNRFSKSEIDVLIALILGTCEHFLPIHK